MGLFKKKKKREEERIEKLPDLPELPKLPEFPKMRGEFEEEPLKVPHPLPSFPNNSFGEKFSQNTIKEAVAGKKEGEGVFDADDFASEDEMQMMQKPRRLALSREVPKEFQEAAGRVRKAEPVFIRLDKFEESMNIFERAKRQISEIEKILRDIKKIKEEEERELMFWEKELQEIKSQIEKIDSEIFSKIE